MHIDAEFALRDTQAAVIVKKILHDPTNDNFSVFLFFIIIIIIISGAPRAREARRAEHHG